jgi:hypothetical protein
LGAATTVDAVEIRWPSGAVEKLPARDLLADRFYSILEGAGIVSAAAIHPENGKSH